MVEITISQKRLLEKALGFIVNDRGIDINNITADHFEYGVKAPEVYGVNWCCRGVQTAGEAKVFAEQLTRAVTVVEFVNNMEFVVDWTKKVKVKADVKEERFEEGFFKGFVMTLLLGIEESVKDALDKFDKEYCKGGK